MAILLVLRVAQVQVLFKLPAQFGTFPHPLAYVEWFTPLRNPEPIVGMFKISQSTRNHRCNAAVVSVGDIMEDSHLSVFAQGEI
jgi:hypothetical protein